MLFQIYGETALFQQLGCAGKAVALHHPGENEGIIQSHHTVPVMQQSFRILAPLVARGTVIE